MSRKMSQEVEPLLSKSGRELPMDEQAYELAGFTDVPSYILGITSAIWERRGLGSDITRYYSPDVRVRGPEGLTVGSHAVTAQTLGMLHQFPDRQLIGEDVIWKETLNRSFLSSHRLMSVMSRRGDGVYGKGDGRPVYARAIADCWVQDGKVKEEWLVRDQAAMAACLGTTAKAMAMDAVARGRAAGIEQQFYTPAADLDSRYIPDIPADPLVEALIAALDRIWNDKESGHIRQIYVPGSTLHAPGRETYYGIDEIDRFVIKYLASFPDARFTVRCAIVIREPEQSVRVALRWTLEGTHSGYGRFGPPTGATVCIMGISHLEITKGKIRSEWFVTDEVATWKQIVCAI